jgi:hypothetical protein
MKWAFIGFVIELYGILVLFGDFFATIAGFAGGIPIVGPYIAKGLNALSGAARSQESAVWGREEEKEGYVKYWRMAVDCLSVRRRRRRKHMHSGSHELGR